MIGLCGASGVGKTTLAMAVTHEMDIHFCKTSTSDVIKSLGLDPSKAMSFDERMRMQEAILSHLSHEWSAYVGEQAITDRTPFDLIAYALADVDSYEALDPDQAARLERYIGACIGAYVNYFDNIVVVPYRSEIWQPVADDKLRPNMTFGYRFKFEILLKGLISHFSIQAPVIEETDLGSRVGELMGYLS